METWKQCALWLVECRVLPESHRVTWEGAQVCELAQALRDGVLLCQLLNNLLPHSVNLKEINLRPQMSQFLCLKNIRTFLWACQEKFHLKKIELFEAFDLFDVRNFAKVLDTLSLLSRSFIAIEKGYLPFPHDGCTADDETYSSLSDQIDDTVDEDEDLYEFVEDDEDEGDEIYEDLMRTESVPEAKKVDKRDCCLQEIRQTEQKYSETLQSILQHFVKPLQKFIQPQDIESIFINMPVESATKHLEKVSSSREDVRMKLEELVKHTSDPTAKDNLRMALDAMRDLAQSVNEVKRDNDIIRQITTFQLSIDNMTQSLALFGRPKIDGELKICSTEKKSKQDRYAFLFDKAMFVCKKRSGETFEMKEVIELQHYQLRDEATGEKDNKKCGYDLFFKTKDQKKKWLEQFEMALYAGNLDRAEAKNLLIARSDGTFLVRQKDAGEFAISIKFNMEIRHIKVTSMEGLFRINEKKAFKGLIEMIQFYEQNSLKECFKDLDTTLETAHKQAEPTSAQGNPPFPGVRRQSAGIVRARYDFSARDRTELSLREGDNIKIISKKSRSGWWKGEVYGRVGFFPANYVDEDHSDYC
ncbi:hypothetical protein CRUP_034654 [Coryphaenoides rupestris]|nr:hypothetical protein CRUP_034654 [Coryphaenoides rupestris]